MSLTHLAEVCVVPQLLQPPQGGTGTVWPRSKNRPLDVVCDYCGSVIEEGRCPSCGAPRRPANRAHVAGRQELPDPTDWGPLANEAAWTSWIPNLLVMLGLFGALAGFL